MPGCSGRSGGRELRHAGLSGPAEAASCGISCAAHELPHPGGRCRMKAPQADRPLAAGARTRLVATALLPERVDRARQSWTLSTPRGALRVQDPPQRGRLSGYIGARWFGLQVRSMSRWQCRRNGGHVPPLRPGIPAVSSPPSCQGTTGGCYRPTGTALSCCCTEFPNQRRTRTGCTWICAYPTLRRRWPDWCLWGRRCVTDSFIEEDGWA